MKKTKEQRETERETGLKGERDKKNVQRLKFLSKMERSIEYKEKVSRTRFLESFISRTKYFKGINPFDQI